MSKPYAQGIKRLQRILRDAVVAVFLITLLAACGKRESRRTAGGGEEGNENILTYGVGNAISQLDPALIMDVESALVATQVYQGLVKFKANSVEVEPDLAESYETSPDGLSWTFKLRKNVRFHDGTPFDANAVMFSVMRQMDPHHPFHVAGKMRYSKLIFGDPSSTETELVREVVAPDSETVVFHLARKYVPFIKNLAMTPASIVSPTAVEKYGRDFNTTMVGTGAFCLKSVNHEDLVHLVRNDSYWGPRPSLDEIRIRVLRDATIRLNSFRKGECDIINSVEPTAIESLEKDSEVTVLNETSMNLGYLVMNCGKPPFNNKLVRQAMNYAVNKQYIVEKLFLNTSVVAKGMTPPGMLGYDETNPGFPHDPGKAKELLAQAGYPNGFTITFSTHDARRVYNPAGKMLAERVQQDLAEIGVTARIEMLEFPAFLDKTRSGDFQIANSGWISDNGDPDNFIYELAGRPDNPSQFYNAEASQVMVEATGESDEAKRAAMYVKAEDMLMDDPPFVYINHSKQILAVRKRVRNFFAHPTAVAQLQNVTVDKP